MAVEQSLLHPGPDRADSQSQQARHNPQASRIRTCRLSQGYVGSQAKNFQTRLQNSSSPHGEAKRLSLTTHCSESGLAGVVKGTLIPFQVI